MKHAMLVLIFVLASSAIALLRQNPEKNLSQTTQTPTPIPTPQPSTNAQNLPQITYQDRMYTYHLEKIPEKLTIDVSSNLEKRAHTSEIFETNTCKILVNGGFYSQENRHLGLLKSKDLIISDLRESALFNGFINISNNQLSVSGTPNNNASAIIQTGPLLIEGGLAKKLTIANDKYARRVTLIKTAKDETYILVLTAETSIHSGPLLSETPLLIFEIASINQLKLSQAINLDGGSHSAFITTTHHFSELNPIGSYLCFK